MATRSRSTARPLSPLDQGELGPAISATADEPTSLEPKVYGEVSLSRAISLLLGLQNQVFRLKRELEEQKEATKEARDWMGAVNQALTCIEARGGTPHTPEDRKPPAIKAMPRPLPKTNPLPAPSAPLVTWANPTKAPPVFAQPMPVQAPHESILPLHLRLSGSNPPKSTTSGPCSHLSSPVKVDHPDAYTGKIGNKARQWLTWMLAWVRLNQRMFPTDQEVLLALIQTVDEFRMEFLAAFGNPNATQAAERQITQLTQTGTCAEYITKFRTIAMDLDWNNAALCGQFARGLHWEVTASSLLESGAHNTPQAAECGPGHQQRPPRGTRQPPRGNKPGAPVTTPNRGTSTGQQATRPGRLSNDPNFVSEEEQNRRRAEAYASSAANQGTSLRNAALAGKPHLRRKASRKKPPRLAKSLDWNWEKTKGTCCCAQGPQGLWLVSHAAILGLKWLDAHNPEIDWNQRTLSFPHAPPEHVAIAEEEKLIRTPLKEFLPNTINTPSMTDAESTTLKDWLRDELKAGKIRPSKSSISSPVMFVPKKDRSRRLVVDYCRLNNRTKKNVYPLPRPDDLMAQLRGAKVFTKLDLRWGYNNVRVKEGDKWKTAFQTKYGLYESLVMTFGLTNAPAAFQHFMNELFKDLLDVCVIIYLDDILIYSKDDASHTQHVHEVLRQLMENQLFCKASKCTFHITSVEYLGIIVSDKGFSLDKLKIQAVQDWPVPTKVKEVQSFLDSPTSSLFCCQL
ncbi:hypothetical protein RHS01_03447 [Rhizoctonia solani]|uniref:Reverse transcriptase domain-containing protein n=1 Tax=Rhizoctonia solani TaxID=456999 RepID=A0A8H7IGM6_9AGAM|nr:hypothetical protein RHS01_03447 [Rhizoctonia solani]